MHTLAAPSGPPLNLTVTGVGPDSVSLSWVAPNPWEQNGIIRHYLIHAQPINLFSLSHRTPSSYTSHNISGLKPFTLYHISVAAVTIATGPTSDTVEVHTSEDSELITKYGSTLYNNYRDDHGLGSMTIHLAHHCFSFNMRWI